MPKHSILTSAPLGLALLVSSNVFAELYPAQGVSSDTTREFYQAFNKEFIQY